jgi:hypothetical protein
VKKLSVLTRVAIRPFSDRVGPLLEAFYSDVQGYDLEAVHELAVAVREILVATADHKSGKTYFTAILLESIVRDALNNLIEQEANQRHEDPDAYGVDPESTEIMDAKECKTRKT